MLGSLEVRSRPISRVLFWSENQRRSFLWAMRRRIPQAIYPGTRRAAVSSPYLILLRVGFAMPCGVSPARGALLPHRFTLATRILRCRSADYSLLHFPSARTAQTLSGTLPYGARTFLDALTRTAIAWPTPQGHSSRMPRSRPIYRTSLVRPRASQILATRTNHTLRPWSAS